MVFAVQGHLDRAKHLIEQADEVSLQYAALELRYALEKVAYQKLKLRLAAFPVEELSKWQPKKVIDTLMAFVDPHLDQDSTISIRPDEGGEWSQLGKTMGVGPREIGKHWNKLSSFLHAKMPKTKGESLSTFSLEKRHAEYLTEVSNYVQALTASQFDAYFTVTCEIECHLCKQKTVYTERQIISNEIIKCGTPSCGCLFEVKIENKQFYWKPFQYHFDCSKCGERQFIDAHKLHAIPYNEKHELKCSCGARYLIRWNLEYSAIDEVAQK